VRTSTDPVAQCEGVDGYGADVLVRVEFEVPELFVPGKVGSFDLTNRGAPITVVAFRQQQLGRETRIAKLFLPATLSASSRTARTVGRRRRLQAWSTAATAACSLRPRRRRKVGVIVVGGAVGHDMSPSNLVLRTSECVWPAARRMRQSAEMGACRVEVPRRLLPGP
jgi:hypothetical protein